MDEPKFRVVDVRRRFLWWLIPPAAVAGIALVVLLAVGHAAGPLQHVTVVKALMASKREFFEDTQVKRVLMAHGYQVHVTPVASFDLAEKADLDSYHFVFPSGQSAADRVRERRQGKHAVAFRPFFSPIVLATFREYADALVGAGVARAQPGQGAPLYYNVEVPKLVKRIESKARWSDYGLGNGNRVIAQAPDPCLAYSGGVYIGLVGFALFGQPPEDEAAAVAMGRAIRPLFAVGGQPPEDMAPKYFAPEGRTFAPIAVLYEHQFVAHQIRTHRQTGKLDEERVLLYPTAQHQSAPELISQSHEGDEIGALLMTNADLRNRAVELGFHVLNTAGAPGIDFPEFINARGVPAARIGDEKALLPANALFRTMIKEVAGCNW